MSRKRIFEILEKAENTDKLSMIYDYVMIAMIVLSLIPLAFKEDYTVLKVMDKVTVCVFIADYFLRWITADYKFEKRGVSSFLKYPFSPMALVDLLSILPSLTIISSGFKGAAGRGTDGNDAAAFLFRAVDLLSRFRVDVIDFAVHDMVLNAVDLYRTERAESNMKRDIGDTDSLILQLFQQILGEVKTGCRCCR